MVPKQPRIFYGWWIVGASFFISLYTTGVINFGFTAVFDPLVKEFGWSYAQISVAASLRGLETGILAPLIGYVTDRWGPRKPLLAGVFIIGLGLVLLGRVNSLSMFYGAFILLSFGMGACSGTLFLTAIAYWFRRRMGMAAAISSSGVALGGLLVPLVALLIDIYGWRSAMVYLGLGTWMICLPLAGMLRHRPEQYGLQSDGDTLQSAFSKNRMPPKREREVRASEVLKYQAFWYISLAFLLQYLVINAVITHVMPYLGNIGLSRALSSFIASAIPITGILGRLLFGWLANRSYKVTLIIICYISTGLSLLLFALVADGRTWLLAPFLICMGLGWGGAIPLRVELTREYFGRKEFGTILGFSMGIQMIGTMIGPVLAGWFFDTQANYQTIWLVFAGLLVISIAFIWATPATLKRMHQGRVRAD